MFDTTTSTKSEEVCFRSVDTTCLTSCFFGAHFDFGDVNDDGNDDGNDDDDDDDDDVGFPAVHRVANLLEPPPQEECSNGYSYVG